MSTDTEAREGWAVARLPERVRDVTANGEAVAREELRSLVVDREHIDVEAADLVVEEAIEDGVLVEEADGLRLSVEFREDRPNEDERWIDQLEAVDESEEVEHGPPRGDT